jgi:hypothetical protein
MAIPRTKVGKVPGMEILPRWPVCPLASEAMALSFTGTGHTLGAHIAALHAQALPVCNYILADICHSAGG